MPHPSERASDALVGAALNLAIAKWPTGITYNKGRDESWEAAKERTLREELRKVVQEVMDIGYAAGLAEGERRIRERLSNAG